MPKNLNRYYLAWELRQKGKKYKEIAEILKVSISRANFLVHFIDFKIKYKKPLPNELKKMINNSLAYKLKPFKLSTF